MDGPTERADAANPRGHEAPGSVASECGRSPLAPPGPGGLPRTLLVVHRREKRSKCSLEPLRRREDPRYVFLSWPLSPIPTLPNTIRLSVDGPPLGVFEEDRERGLLLIDGTWKLAAPMHRAFAAVPARSLPGYHTGYPRASKIYPEPPGGLASIEALYIACHLLGRPTDGLLDGYRWRDAFLSRNTWAPPGTFPGLGARSRSRQGPDLDDS